MIRQATAEDNAAVLALTRQHPATGAMAAMHWQLWRENNLMPHKFYFANDTCFIKLSGKSSVLCGVPTTAAQAEEIAEFFHFCGTKRLTSAGWYPPSWYMLEDSAVMVRSPAPAPAPSWAGLAGGAHFEPDPTVDDVLYVLEAETGRMEPEGVREGFWVDFHIRHNHNTARVCGIRSGNTLVSTAGAYAIANGAAYIACVETLPTHRDKGYAGLLLQQLCSEFAQHELSLLCMDSMGRFYNRFGFQYTGQRGYVSQSLPPEQPQQKEAAYAK